MKGIRVGALLLLIVAVSACAPQRVKPWQRGDLAQPIMAFDPDPLEAAQRQHTYTSKEAAFGGGALGGGGCGCN